MLSSFAPHAWLSSWSLTLVPFLVQQCKPSPVKVFDQIPLVWERSYPTPLPLPSCCTPCLDVPSKTSFLTYLHVCAAACCWDPFAFGFLKLRVPPCCCMASCYPLLHFLIAGNAPFPDVTRSTLAVSTPSLSPEAPHQV